MNLNKMWDNFMVQYGLMLKLIHHLDAHGLLLPQHKIVFMLVN